MMGTDRHKRRAYPASEPVEPDYRARRRVLLAVMTLGLGAVLWGAAGRQVVETEYLQDQGRMRYFRQLQIPVHRGEIRDRSGEPLAVSTPVVSVWADARKVPSNAAILGPLATILGVDASDLRQRLAQRSDRGFVYLKRGLNWEAGDEVQALIKQHKAEGLGLEQEYRRFYPSGEVAAHVVGFTDIDDRGQEGMELAYDGWLTGEPGARRVIQDGRGRIVEEVEQVRAPRPGRDMDLSLDRRLQFLAYRELKKAVDTHKAKGATAVILDVDTGEVLAMVNQPSYNPNDRSSIRPNRMRNRAVTDVFEPGSTIKPLVVAASLDAGRVTPTTPMDTSPGFMAVGRNRVRDVHNYGLLDVTGVITKSSNVGVTKLALDLEPEYLWNLFKNLGIGEPTQSNFPGESMGQLPHFKGWSRFEQATHSFGYGMSGNVLQLARAYAVVASGGVRRPVTMLKVDHAPAGERVMRPETARAVLDMLETVVSPKGTAKQAAIPGYRVGGKTGTVKKSVAGGYASDRYQSVFVGVAPISRPKLVMAVMVDEPGGKDYYGGLVAAPVFAKTMADALRLLNVEPDAPQGGGSAAGGRMPGAAAPQGGGSAAGGAPQGRGSAAGARMTEAARMPGAAAPAPAPTPTPAPKNVRLAGAGAPR